VAVVFRLKMLSFFKDDTVNERNTNVVYWWYFVGRRRQVPGRKPVAMPFQTFRLPDFPFEINAHSDYEINKTGSVLVM